MGLWKHGVEQILAEAGMPNQETERKTLARYISTKVRRGAMCSPSRQTEKGEIIFIGSFYVEQEKGQHKTETKFPSRGYVLIVQKGRVKEITSRRCYDLL